MHFMSIEPSDPSGHLPAAHHRGRVEPTLPDGRDALSIPNDDDLVSGGQDRGAEEIRDCAASFALATVAALLLCLILAAIQTVKRADAETRSVIEVVAGIAAFALIVGGVAVWSNGRVR